MNSAWNETRVSRILIVLRVGRLLSRRRYPYAKARSN
jgi:hypothetical protein